MLDNIIVWCNKTLFLWFDPSNATHTVLMAVIGTLVASITIPILTWPFLRGWSYARRVAIDENRRTRRYLRSLEKRARTSIYWESASAAQRIQFVVLRVALVLISSVTLLACQGIVALGLIIQTSQDDAPKNIVAIMNAAKDAANGTGMSTALLQQQYVFPSILLMIFATILIFLTALSTVIYILKTVRLAEIEDRLLLLQAINSIRKHLNLARLTEDSSLLKPPQSLLYPS